MRSRQNLPELDTRWRIGDIPERKDRKEHVVVRDVHIFQHIDRTPQRISG
jgi:hypothetical protein